MITKVQVALNMTDDSILLSGAVLALKACTGLETLYTDESSGSPENDRLLEAHEVRLVPTAIRGRRRAPERLSLDDFQVEREPGGEPQRVVCPQQATAEVRRSRSGKSFEVVFAEGVCADCPLRARWPTKPRKRRAGRVLRFTWQDLRRAERRRRVSTAAEGAQDGAQPTDGSATVRSLKHPFAGGKAPVCRQFRWRV